MSAKSLQKLVPDSLHTQKLLVVSKFEDAETLRQRRNTVQSRSVSELSQISSLSDFPIPEKLEKLMTLKRKQQMVKSKSGENLSKRSPKDYSHLSPMAIHDTIYSTLPRSMKSELLVKAQVAKGGGAASHKVKARKELVEAKSVNELSQVRTLAEVPIPSPIQNLMEKSKQNLILGAEDDASSQCTG